MTALPVSEAGLDDAPMTLADGLFRDRVVLVSGGGSGIGKATAWMMARLGAKVAICGRTAERLLGVETAFRDRGWPLLAQTCDIRDEQAVESLFDAVEARFGLPNILVNNAGGQFALAADKITPKGWRAVIETNLTGTWLMMQTAAQRWIAASRGGVVVNVTAANERGMPGIAHSSAARAGVVNASRTAAVEWAPYGIRINCLAPGLVDSGGLSVYPPEARAGFHRANPQRSVGHPWDMAQIIGFLASDSARYVTGATLTADGGGALWGDLWTIERPVFFSDTQQEAADHVS
ncbi:SDR family oxidoreductase [Sphingobium terrigena]|uniref:Peroxisomal trans-2-enoyl-CoA reductase n=1 Tax=Sphingobium terrigena TaxID=2304063 RepID=A0A418YYE1_9SPHN|nr:SDR family oxidoreductase [Sphingobium terrigena]RJG57876.1 SDR family oxidoreductase [Sphingobium terrigena]